MEKKGVSSFIAALLIISIIVSAISIYSYVEQKREIERRSLITLDCLYYIVKDEYVHCTPEERSRLNNELNVMADFMYLPDIDGFTSIDFLLSGVLGAPQDEKTMKEIADILDTLEIDIRADERIIIYDSEKLEYAKNQIWELLPETDKELIVNQNG